METNFNRSENGQRSSEGNGENTFMTSGVIHCFSAENRSKPTSVRICIPTFFNHVV